MLGSMAQYEALYCYHNDKQYAQGAEIRQGCKSCRCEGQDWSCDQKQCSGEKGRLDIYWL